MAKTVKLNDDIVASTRQEAVLHDRSLGAPAKVYAALAGEIQTRELTAEEKGVWLDRFTEIMGEQGPEEEAFFADRRRRGLGVGLDEKGKLVHAEPDPAA